jgi:hypothetical protein
MLKIVALSCLFVFPVLSLNWAEQPSGMVVRDHPMIDEQMRDLKANIMLQYESTYVSYCLVKLMKECCAN